MIDAVFANNRERRNGMRGREVTQFSCYLKIQFYLTKSMDWSRISIFVLNHSAIAFITV